MSEKTSVLTTAMNNAKAKMAQASDGAVELDDRAKLDAAKHLAKRVGKYALIVGTTAIVTRLATVRQLGGVEETPED